MSYLEDFIKLTVQQENCESDNWGDACNFVGMMEDEIKRLKEIIKDYKP